MENRWRWMLIWTSVLLSCLAFQSNALAAVLTPPGETIEIHLKATDPPAEVTLNGWFCSSSDDTGSKLDVAGTVEDLTEGEVKRRVDPRTPPDPPLRYVIYARNNWGYDIQGNVKGLMRIYRNHRVVKHLDAPAGGMRYYFISACYTRGELENFVKIVANHITVKMDEVLDYFRKPPFNDSEEYIQKNRWYVAPPPIYRTGALRHHRLLVVVTRSENDKPARGTSRSQSAEEKTGSTPGFGGAAGDLRGDIYYLREGTRRLPDFSGMKPVGAIRTNALNVPARDFRAGFPGLGKRVEWFGIHYRGAFRVAREGTYRFRLVSDDGAKLFIDGRLVVNNDGLHPPSAEEGGATLSSGMHKLEVHYMQGPKWEVALQLFARCGGQWRIWNTRLLGSDAGAACVEKAAGKALEELLGRWDFGRTMEHGKKVNKHLCAVTLTDQPGKYGGYRIRSCDENESYWSLEGGTLLFRHRDGSVTTRFTRKGKDVWEGAYFPRPDHPNLGKVRHYLRRIGAAE